MDALKPSDTKVAANLLDRRTWALRWLVAFLRNFSELPEESEPYWRFYWGRAPAGILAHFFHNGTTYVCGEEGFDWREAARLCRSEFLPERVIGDRFAVEHWQGACPGFFERALSLFRLDVLAVDPKAIDVAVASTEGFRVARDSDRPVLEEYERLHCREVDLEPVYVDFQSLIRNELVFVVEDDGQVTGCVRSNLSDGRYVHVGGLFVHPRFRGRGFGRRLAQGMAWWIHTHHQAVALLDAYDTNAAALEAYRQAGYRKVGEGIEARFGEDAWE